MKFLLKYYIDVFFLQVLQRYWLKKSDKFDIKPSVRTQMTPGPELPVMFVER